MRRIGFMQGRLVDQVDGKIQAFPWEQWQLEFPRAFDLGLNMIEWTLDDTRLEENPFITAGGQEVIRSLMLKHGVKVPSLTGDCFMQAPFWKCYGSLRVELLRKLDLVLAAASELNVQYVVVPLVDNGKLENEKQRELLITQLLQRSDYLRRNGVQIIFETDYAPEGYRDFIVRLPADTFNVNYDIGNSASLGFDSGEEFSAYGNRIVNVHVKDRILGGTTVPLGAGAADFDRVFSGLAKLGYSGNYILQTARTTDGNHAATLAKYAGMTAQWLARHYGS